MVELPEVSGEVRKVNKVAESFDKYFSNGEENKSGCTSELYTFVESVSVKEKKIKEAKNKHSVRVRTKKTINITEEKENTEMAESSGKGKRRLVKERSSRNRIDLDSDHENSNDQRRKRNEDNSKDYVFELGETSALRHHLDSTTQNRNVDEIDEFEDWSQSAILKRRKPLEDDGSLNYDKHDLRREQILVTDEVTAQVSCIICWTEFSTTRGILPCGHRFCYSCIQKWVDRLVSERKKTTCPLCKSGFVTITKVEDAGSSDQNIYSQTVPDPSLTNNTLVVLPEEDRQPFNPMTSRVSGCIRCYCSEPEDLLIRCHICNFRHIHSYCLDPYLLPWTCNHCNDLQMLYQRRSY